MEEKRRRPSAELREEWSRNIADWKESGLSGTAWCRGRGIPYPRFMYWKRNLSVPVAELPGVPEEPMLPFIEIGPELSAGLVLECRGVRIYVDGRSDLPLLSRVLGLVREI
jgi:hypothetical protein